MKTILVIEDEKAVRNNIAKILTLKGFAVISAENGQVGIQLAQDHQPDLIVCDILMPQINGYEVLARLQDDVKTRTIPFIFLTAKVERSEQRRGMALGADDYITKPFTMDELMDAIEVKLKKKLDFDANLAILTEELHKIKQFLETKERIMQGFNQELRRPLSNIKMVLELLSQSPKEFQQKEYIRILQTEFKREISLLNQLEELQKIINPENAQILAQLNLLDRQQDHSL
ncbi:response regulator [Spirulina subsalsa FACHB-351]|uniref:histidine kinase n=2 Tax=Spirulina subsalsa TaxID=54311 RepID=A0ABT3L7Y2_9CYAN|nr:response regulator [Spirulina subsalsa FACHB-351]